MRITGARAAILATIALAIIPTGASASTAAPPALPAGLSPATLQAALSSGDPNPAQQVVLDGAVFPGGGTQVSFNAIAYESGTVVLTAGSGPVVGASASVFGRRKPRAHAATVFACNAGTFCLYRNSNYDTPSGQTYFASSAGGGTQYQLSAYNFNDTDSSWINNRSGNVRVHNNWPLGSNDYFTATGSSQAPNLSGTWNDQGSGLSFGS